MEIDTDLLLGLAIKEQRIRNQFTLQDLEKLSGLSRSFLSKVERGKAVPSIQALRSIGKALGITASDLLTKVDHNPVEVMIVKKNERREVARSPSDFGYSYWALANSGHAGRIETFVVRFSVGSKPSEPFVHEGFEFNFVLKGRARLLHGSNTYMLDEGDSIFYNSSVPHYVLAEGGAETIILVVFEYDH